ASHRPARGVHDAQARGAHRRGSGGAGGGSRRGVEGPRPPRLPHAARRARRLILYFARRIREHRALVSHAGAPEVSVVVPIFNEERTLAELYRRLRAVLDEGVDGFEIVLVNDGSRDGSLALMRALAVADRRVKVVSLSRNFGHQTSI